MNIVVKKILNKNGLTFIEVIVALGVLLTAIISGLTLTTFNLNASTASENRLLAANLGREAIEVVRGMRDSNWLVGNDWNNGILQDPVNNYRLTAIFDPDANSWSTQDQTADIGNCTNCVLYRHSGNGVYSHIQGVDGLASTFKRLVTINEICWQPAVGDETILGDGSHCAASGLDFIGWQLTCDLTWRDNRINHQMQVVDRIYDWR